MKGFLQQFAFTALILALLAATSGCAPAKEKTPLRVMFAGSLTVPFQALEEAYEAQHPDVDVQFEGHGSVQLVRHITEIHDPVDVAAVADYTVIPSMMYTSHVPQTDQPYARWYIKFAANRLALAYTSQSQYADEIDADNWFQIIARPGVKTGISDPRFDPLGYRSLVALQLAETYYGQSDIFENLIGDHFKTPFLVQEEGERTVIQIPENLEPKPDSSLVVRNASVQLIALLQSGDLDYAFGYESIIQQHGLQVIPLPEALNLSDEKYAQQYNQVQIRLDFQRSSSAGFEISGKTINYGLTIPTNAPHPGQAVDFVAFLLGPEGQAVMEANHHPLIIPPEAHNYSALPRRLKKLCVPMP